MKGVWSVLVIVVAAVLTALQASAQSAPAPVVKSPAPTTDVDPATCATVSCHPEVKNYKFLHGPVNVNACNQCHKLVDASKHQYVDTHPKGQECISCHKMDLTAPVIHKPVQSGDCLPCHNPHGGKTNKFIRGDSTRQVCAKCHKDTISDKSHIHGPVAAGACEVCHSPHTSKNPKLLVATGRDLCTGCHKEMGDQLKMAKVIHKPAAEGDCMACHDPHASNFVMQIKAPPAELCTSCHEHDKIKQAAMDAKFKHSVVTDGQACLNCHTPHGGTLAKLLKAAPVEICLKCHKDDQKAPDGHPVPAVGQIANTQLTRHGPAKDGTCSGCHNVHGSDVSRLLAKPYPETFYTKYDPDNFALCFTCHDKKLIETKEAEGLTGFRNGTKNLHFLHVDREKGRTCRACHETHAASSPVLIRDSVPFGQWELPVNYKKTETGGSCAPGCHRQYGYDRTNAIDNAAANVVTIQPATTAAAKVAAATAPAPTATPDLVPVPAPAPARTLQLMKDERP